ncbi:MAG: branched-chain amino acid transaminase [Candidatus Oxydemutatoraceae bacterium WSBS_2016_MAG_OTU14]
MENNSGVIWLDGKFVPWKDAKVHVLTHTLHYGVGVFEGVRAYPTDKGPAIFRLQDHTQRLFDSAHSLRMKIPYTKEELNEVQCEIVKQNKLESAYIRPLIFYGAEGMGLNAKNLKVRCTIISWEWGAYLGEENMQKGIRVCTSSFARHHVATTMTKAKACGNYLNSVLSLQEAVSAGCDEALILDTDGYICEGSGENIFLVRNNILYTPQLSSALDGITRRTLIKLAKESGYEVSEQRLTRDVAYTADEAFFTGTAAEVTPIREIDGRAIGSGTRGPVTTQLQQLYFDVIHGRNDQYKDWLTPV